MTAEVALSNASAGAAALSRLGAEVPVRPAGCEIWEFGENGFSEFPKESAGQGWARPWNHLSL